MRLRTGNEVVVPSANATKSVRVVSVMEVPEVFIIKPNLSSRLR